MKVLNDHKGDINGDVRLTPEDIKIIAYCLTWCEGEDMITCEDHLMIYGKLAEQFRRLDVHFREKVIDSDT